MHRFSRCVENFHLEGFNWSNILYLIKILKNAKISCSAWLLVKTGSICISDELFSVSEKKSPQYLTIEEYIYLGNGENRVENGPKVWITGFWIKGGILNNRPYV